MASADAHVVMDSMTNLNWEKRSKIRDAGPETSTIETAKYSYTLSKGPHDDVREPSKATLIHRLSFDPSPAPSSRTLCCTRGAHAMKVVQSRTKNRISLEHAPSG
ncbi:hypothetical protein DPSP01_012988 [Paraphaeosphaeria sporulosa]